MGSGLRRAGGLGDDIWGKLRRVIESADSAFLASVANYDAVQVTLIGDVASAYVQTRTTERQTAIAQDNVERQRAGAFV